MALFKNILNFKCLLFLALQVLALQSIAIPPAFSQPSRNSFRLVEAFPNLSFNQPLDFQVTAADPDYYYVAERAGKILRFSKGSATATATEFLNVNAKVTVESDELGLLGFAFHPNFHTNGYVYINYTATAPLRTVISRFTRKQDDNSKVDPATELVILEYTQPYSNHNGGQIAFGPDGYLYVSSGDGGSAGDPDGNAQKLTNLLGKILRIDVDLATEESPYAIPATNPFISTAGAAQEILAYGLRNPWRMSFDSATGKLWAGDVGQDAREEINIITKGKNYGWNIREGKRCYQPSSGCTSAGLTKPVYDYSHSLGESITGGYVYRGSRHRVLRGYYIYADFVSGRVWGLRPATATRRTRNVQLLDSSLFISAFGQNLSKELFVLSYEDGKIYKLRRS